MSIFRTVLNMIRITLSFHTKKHWRDFSSVFPLCIALDFNPYVTSSEAIIEYHNQNYLSSVFFYLIYSKNSFNFFSTSDRDKPNGFLLTNSHKASWMAIIR